MGFILTIANICAGFLLGASALDKLDGEKNVFNKIALALAPFNAIIGGICLVLGLYYAFKPYHLILDLVSIACGFILLTASLSKVPALGGTLVKISNSLMPFKVIIGISALIAGILSLLNII